LRRKNQNARNQSREAQRREMRKSVIAYVAA
jgi:hypothetical protein